MVKLNCEDFDIHNYLYGVVRWTLNRQKRRKEDSVGRELASVRSRGRLTVRIPSGHELARSQVRWICHKKRMHGGQKSRRVRRTLRLGGRLGGRQTCQGAPSDQKGAGQSVRPKGRKMMSSQEKESYGGHYSMWPRGH